MQPDYLLQPFIDSGFIIQNLSVNDSSTLFHLTATFHKDPFDRMLIWIAINNNYTLISDDQLIKQYTDAGLQIVW